MLLAATLFDGIRGCQRRHTTGDRQRHLARQSENKAAEIRISGAGRIDDLFDRRRRYIMNFIPLPVVDCRTVLPRVTTVSGAARSSSSTGRPVACAIIANS